MKNRFRGLKNSKGFCGFLGGVVFGTAGIAILASDEAKKVYTHCTAAALRAKERVMKQATTIQENAADIYADALDINEKKNLDKASGIIEGTSN